MTSEEVLNQIYALINEYKTLKMVKEETKKDVSVFNATASFPIIWKRYPANRRDNKPKCLKIFKETVKNIEDFEKITKALEYYLGCNEDVQRGFIKLSSTWFGQGWEMWWEMSQEIPSSEGINKHFRRPQ